MIWLAASLSKASLVQWPNVRAYGLQLPRAGDEVNSYHHPLDQCLAVLSTLVFLQAPLYDRPKFYVVDSPC